jgi:hypothetical protein
VGFRTTIGSRSLAASRLQEASLARRLINQQQHSEQAPIATQ